MSPIPLAWGLALVLAAVGACAPPGSSPAVPSGAVESDTAESDTALVVLVQEPDGSAHVTVTFRSEGDAEVVAISPRHTLRIETPSGTFEAPIAGEPRGRVGESTTESSADYRLAEPGVLAMEQAGERARVSVHDGRGYRTYAVRRIDFLE